MSTIQELSQNELLIVQGGGVKESGAAAALATGIGASVWGGGMGAIGVGAAFAASPFAAAAMIGLAFYAGYQLMAE